MIELLSDCVVAQMRRETAVDDGAVEIGWIGRADDTGRLVEIELMARGSNAQCPLMPSDAIARGWNYLWHSHPKHAFQPRPYPSEADIRVALECGMAGIGFGIVNAAVTDAFVVRLPRPNRVPSGPKPRVWSVGPFTLIHHRSNRHES